MTLSTRPMHVRGRALPLHATSDFVPRTKLVFPSASASRLCSSLSYSSSSSSSSSSPRTTTTNVARAANTASTFSFPTAPTDAPSTQPPNSSSLSFNWDQQWYPVLCAVTTDAARPHAVRVLGRDLVVWRDAVSGRWHAADDACPHRLAPLSEGRIEVRKGKGKGKEGDKSGCEACVLACAYHGWEFDAKGSCVRIPQMDDDASARATALASPRSRVRSYPVRVDAGLVFVWPDPEPGAEGRASRADPPPVPAEVIDKVEESGWYVRDVAYPYEILLENLTDPSHLPVSHHGLAMLRRENAKPVPMTLITAAPGAAPPTGYSKHPAVDVAMASVQSPPNDLRPTARLAWSPPSFVRYRYSAGPSIYSTNLYATPTAPGTARVFLADAAYPMPEGGFVDVFDGVVKKKQEAKETDGNNDAASTNATAEPPEKKLEAASRPAPPKLLLLQRIVLMKVLSLFPWIRHWMQGTIFDGDGILLAGQAKRMASLEAASSSVSNENESKKWPQLYYMPASCDVFVTQLRKWLDTEAGGGPRWAPGVASAAAAGAASSSSSSASSPDAALTPGSIEERRRVLDRKAQHVRLCTVCQKGERQLQQARNLLVGLSLFALLALAAVVGGWLFGGGGGGGGGGVASASASASARVGVGVAASSNRAAAAGAAACSLVAAAAARAASWIHWSLLPNFGFRDYVHAHKD